jgi:hypothetical protein
LDLQALDAFVALVGASGPMEAEVVCEAVSAEEGRLVHRGAWSHLADLVDADLRAWLSAHPGRYLLKMTLPQGLRGGLHEAMTDGDALAILRMRIGRRACDASTARPGRCPGAAARAAEFPQRSGGSRRPVALVAPGVRTWIASICLRRRRWRLCAGRAHRPLLAMFVDDADRAEWRGLREQLELECEARKFLAHKDARPVVAVSCASRFELFGMSAPDAADGGELRFRNPAHPAARAAALAPAVLSSV